MEHSRFVQAESARFSSAHVHGSADPPSPLLREVRVGETPTPHLPTPAGGQSTDGSTVATAASPFIHCFRRPLPQDEALRHWPAAPADLDVRKRGRRRHRQMPDADVRSRQRPPGGARPGDGVVLGRRPDASTLRHCVEHTDESIDGTAGPPTPSGNRAPLPHRQSRRHRYKYPRQRGHPSNTATPMATALNADLVDTESWRVYLPEAVIAPPLSLMNASGASANGTVVPTQLSVSTTGHRPSRRRPHCAR